MAGGQGKAEQKAESFTKGVNPNCGTWTWMPSGQAFCPYPVVKFVILQIDLVVWPTALDLLVSALLYVCALSTNKTSEVKFEE